MIQFANTETTPLVRSMWKTCFGDTEEYLDLHFTHKYRPENTLLYFVDNKAVASLQMLPYTFRIYGEIVPFYYLAGLCTLEQFRNKGYMGQLMKKSYKVMLDRQIPICGLVPAEEWLFDYYTKYGFAEVFDESKDSIDLKSILNMPNIFETFDKQYQQSDFLVLKNKDDFEAIIADYKAEDYPPKHNLRGMARAISPEKLLVLYASKNIDQSFSIKVEDESFEIKNGKVSIIDSPICDFTVNISLFTRLILGYNTQQLPPEYSFRFKEHSPILNLMLE